MEEKGCLPEIEEGDMEILAKGTADFLGVNYYATATVSASRNDGTLSRLGTDYLDLYIIHRFDYETPIEETMEALHELVKMGKVRVFGASAMYGYQFYNMQLAAKEHGWTPFSKK